MTGRAALLSTMALAAAPLPAAEQQPMRPDRPFRFSVGSEAVTLDVVVTDRRGRFVDGLAREDFTVLEEGEPQELTYFTAATTPVTILLLLDNSASVRSNLDAIQKAANRFLSRLSSQDQARVGLFHERVVFGPRFTNEMQEHIALIRNMRPHRRTLLHDAVIAGLEVIGAIGDRKAIVLFTDGEDAGSAATADEALEAARRANVSIYTVGFIGWSFEKGMSVNQEFLERLAGDTGGSAFFPENERRMRSSFDRIQEELHRQYRMAYVPQGGRPGWRSIEVKVPRRPDLTVRTRIGYYRETEETP